jgi:hypothetical protein
VEQEAEDVDESGGVAELVVRGRVQVRAGVEVKWLSTWKRKIVKHFTISSFSKYYLFIFF